MGQIQFQGFVQAFFKISHRLVRQSEDQVDGHVFESGPSCVGHRSVYLLGCVDAADFFQDVVIEGLDPHA
ncbi:hypothetical protein SDC9_204852 [bioreactor metagenome]|uniref:Uncharacterized protein n=1 Tax=bioreactor metagenome TaxID=1076179 RepID=A0A645J0E7_9ZZZZ